MSVLDLQSQPRGAASSAELAARPSATGKDRIVALDGLRAIGVLVIMGFHFGLDWLPGGFVGVDLFYVLSGYLITGLLVGEFKRRTSIKLSSFWLRRARRLLPALLIMLVVVTLLVRYDTTPGTYPDFRMSALSSLFYFSNWWQIAASGNYFVATGPPSPLTHTWSLAVEEQFYLIWPLVVLAVMHFSRVFARGIKVLLTLSVAGVVAATLEMALRYGPTVNTTRLYFGTDTHAQSVMVGAALACLLTIVQLRRGADGMAPSARTGIARFALLFLGLCGLGGILTLSVEMAGTDALTYEGGILLAAGCSAALIAGAVCVRAGFLARGLALRPLVWMGTVSYGAYLWHYPIAVFMDSQATGLSGFWLFSARFATTFAIAGASYYLVERPIIVGTFWRSLRAVAPAAAAMAVTVVVIVAGTALPTAPAVAVHRFRAPSAAAVIAAAVHPPLVVVLGDSTAASLSVALQYTAPTGTTVTDGGLFGCGLAIGSWVSNDPPTPGLAMFPACNSATPPDQQWPAFDTTNVRPAVRGDVVLFIAGPWETQDIERNGYWTNITQRSFQHYELSQMRTLVGIATAHGAHLILATMAETAAGAAFHQKPAAQDSQRRRLIYDRLLMETAKKYPGKVSMLDLGNILSPRGVFHLRLDGVQIRTPDGIHTPSYEPGNPFTNNSTQAVADAFYNWISPRIWPLILEADGSRPRKTSTR
jgi:peptidoglycan/LPS O-acetylase OafA/YrhL